MKKLFINFVCLVLMMAFLSSAEAINRSPKNSQSDKKSETDSQRDDGEQKTTLKIKEKPKGLFETKKGSEKYDYFIDRNNNGIDDRLEKNIETKEIKKPKAPKETSPVPSEKSSPKVSPPTKKPEKIKDQTPSEPKKEAKTEKREEGRRRNRR